MYLYVGDLDVETVHLDDVAVCVTVREGKRGDDAYAGLSYEGTKHLTFLSLMISRTLLLWCWPTTISVLRAGAVKAAEGRVRGGEKPSMSALEAPSMATTIG